MAYENDENYSNIKTHIHWNKFNRSLSQLFPLVGFNSGCKFTNISCQFTSRASIDFFWME